MEIQPYSADEARVAKWISDLSGIGGGDDPIGFLLASYQMVIHERKEMKREIESSHRQIRALQDDNDRLANLLKLTSEPARLGTDDV